MKDFTRWLHAVANRLLGFDSPLHDDLVNEGAIAMWRAFERNEDPDPGRQIAYAIKCAENRMKGLAWGKAQPMGHEPMRGSKPAEESPVLDGLEPEEQDCLAPVVQDFAEIAAMAYHQGEIYRALDGLSEAQRNAAYAVMHDMSTTKTEKNNWYKAREKLAAELGHLNMYSV